jgi:hypothetical protein
MKLKNLLIISDFIITGLLNAYFFYSEFKLLFNPEYIQDINLSDYWAVTILAFRIPFVLFALPIFFIFKIADFFEIAPQFEYFQIKLFYWGTYIILSVLLAIKMLSSL